MWISHTPIPLEVGDTGRVAWEDLAVGAAMKEGLQAFLVYTSTTQV